MADLKEQRVCVKLCFLVGKTAAETVTVLKEAFKDEAMGKTQVYKWLNRFKRGEMSVEDQLRCGHSATSRSEENVGKVHQAVLEDCHQNIDEISEIMCVLCSSCQCILMEDLMMKWVAALSAHRGVNKQVCECLP
jgi:hypothetical protein